MRRSPSLPSAGLALAALLASVASGPVAAQVFTGVGPTAVVPIAAARPVAAPEAPRLPTETLRFLPNTLEGLRLTGETGDLRWPVYLTAAQAAAPVKLRLGYTSAVSILPDASRLEMRVNDQLVGSDAIDAASGLRTVDFALPAGLLRPGYNAIALNAQQRHRVDCSVAATYELWTRIDPAESGLVLSGADVRVMSDLADLPALLPRADGAMPIHIVMTGKVKPAHLQRLIAATQQIALNGRFQQPAVDFDTDVADPYGLDLAVGTRDALATLPRLTGSLGLSGTLARFVPGETGRPLLVLTGSTPAEVDEAIAQLAAVAAAAPTGTPAGLFAARNAPATPVAGGEHLTLHDLGLRDAVFSGRLFRRGFDLKLPADFLPSDYARGTFDIAGGYAPGLAAGAQVRFDVNGHSSGVVKMPYAKGDTFDHNQLFMPLSLLRPGLNHIDIVAETPRPEDATCAASADKRFLFLDKSRLTLPTLARVERLPDLVGMTGGGLPYTRGAARLVVPKPDRETMAAALSLTARAAVAAGRPIPFAFATSAAGRAGGSTLVVSPAQSLDPALLTEAGLDPAKIEAAWKGLVPPTRGADASLPPSRWWVATSEGPAACALPPHASQAVSAQSPAKPSPRAAALDTDSDDILERWSGTERARDGWREKLMAASSTMSAWIDRVRGPKRGDGDGIVRDTSLILAQGIDRGPDDSVTTIVTAPDATTLRASVACLFAPQVWSKVHGRLAALDAADGSVSSIDATSLRYVSSGTGSLGNARLVLAGWFSLNPIAFVAMALLMALCLSGTTLWFVRGVGRRPE